MERETITGLFVVHKIICSKTEYIISKFKTCQEKYLTFVSRFLCTGKRAAMNNTPAFLFQCLYRRECTIQIGVYIGVISNLYGRMSKELTYDFNIYFGFDKPCCKGVAQGMDSNRLYSQGFLHTLKD